MKKQEIKKSTKWILLAAGVVVLLVLAGLAFVLFGGQGAQTEPTGEFADLYWNIDRLEYAGKSDAGLSSREKEADGYFHIMFAINGEQAELLTDSAKIVNRIDSEKVMGFTLGENNQIVEVLDVEDITGGIVADEFYVQEVEDNVANCNSSESFDGMSVELVITENTRIYDVNPKAEVVGAPSELEPADRVIAIQNTAGELTHIFITQRVEISDIYWNVDRQYNSTAKVTKRVPDENGEYNILLAVNGEQKVIKTKSEVVATNIDNKDAKCFGLLFDEEGYAVEVVPTNKVTGGPVFASWYDVTEINGRTVTAEKIVSGDGQGNIHTADMIENCPIYDVTGYFPKEVFVGQACELNVGDRIHGLRNAKGEIVIIFVVHRMVPNAQIIWNIDRITYWSSSKNESTRKPNADGYYEMRVAHEGALRTLYIKDKEFLDTIERTYSARGFAALIDENDFITDAFPVAAAIGQSSSFASWYDVTQIQGAIVQAEKTISGSGQGNTAMGILSPNVKIYNVSPSYEVHEGEVTDLRVGDRIHGFKDPSGNVVYVFIVNRPIDSEMYYNVDRNYDSTNKVTKRTPDWDGYYRIRLAVNGKHVTYKTKDKKVVDELDSRYYMGLYLDGDVIRRSVASTYVKGYDGGTVVDWGEVVSLSGTKGKAIKHSAASNTGKEWEFELAEGYVTYDVSTYSSFIGKKTTLGIGDRVVGLKNADGQVVLVYVMAKNTHKYGSKWSAYKYCDHCGKNVFWLPWNGSTIQGYYSSSSGKLVKSSGQYGHYYVPADLELTGSVKGIGSSSANTRYTNLDVVLDLNGFTIEHTENRAFLISSGSTLTIVDNSSDDLEKQGKIVSVGQPPDVNKETGAKSYKSSGVIQTYEGPDKLGATLNLMAGTIQLADDHNLLAGGGGVNIGTNTTFNMYGGKVIGGKLQETYKAEAGKNASGGTLNVNGTFNMYGGTVTGGTGYYGGNVYVVNEMNMYGGTIEGGVSYYRGGNIYVSSTGKATFSGGTVTNGDAKGNSDPNAKGTGGNIFGYGKAVVTLKGDAVISNGDSESYGMNINVQGATGATLNIQENAKIIASTEEEAYPSVYVYCGKSPTAKTVVNMSGGTISGAKTTGAAGNVMIEGSMTEFNMSGGTIKDGQAPKRYGGNIGVIEGATFNMTGGTLENGVAGSDGGGNLYVGKNSLAVVSGGTITGGEAINGGAVSVYTGGTLKINGGTIQNGTASKRGGTLFVNAGGQVEMNDGTIKGGTVTSQEKDEVGGTICVFGNEDSGRGVFTMNGGIIGSETAAENSTARYGANLFLYSGEFILNDGVIFGGTATSEEDTHGGGAVCLRSNYGTVPSLFTMNGGGIVGGTGKVGGAVNVGGSTGNFTMNGGTIKGGTATENGGNVAVVNGATFQLNAGTIENGVSPEVGGTEIFVANGKLGLTGVAKAKVQLGATGLLKLDDLQDGSEIVIDAKGVFTDGTVDDPDDAYAGYFSHVDTVNYYTFEAVDGALKVTKSLRLDPITSEAELSSGKGGYKLENGFAITTPITVDGDMKVDLNGQTLTSDGAASMFILDSDDDNLTIADSSQNGDGKIVVTNAAGTVNGVIVKADKGQFTLENGTLDGSGYTTGAVNGLLVYTGSSAVFTMENGTIIGGTTTGSGGAVCAQNNFYMNGGTIKDGNAKDGGNILLASSGHLIMNGGTISGGEATGKGGNIRIWDSAKVTISGGEVTLGYATSYGGNLYADKNATITLNGTGIISAGNSATWGANIALYGTVSSGKRYVPTLNIADDAQIIGSDTQNRSSVYLYGGGTASTEPDKHVVVNMTGGTIKDGKSIGNNRSGGNIYAEVRVTFNMSGGTISGGSVTGGAYGGNVYMAGAIFNMTKGTLADSTETTGTVTGGSAKNGGNFYVNSGTLNIEAGTVSDGNVTDLYGGNIFAKTTLTITGGTISGGKLNGTVPGTDSYSKAYNVWVEGANGAVTISNATIEGGMCVYKANTLTVSGKTVIKGNTVYDLVVKPDGVATVDFSGVEQDADIGLAAYDTPAADATVEFGPMTDATLAACFKSAVATHTFAVEGGKLVLVPVTVPTP